MSPLLEKNQVAEAKVGFSDPPTFAPLHDRVVGQRHVLRFTEDQHREAGAVLGAVGLTDAGRGVHVTGPYVAPSQADQPLALISGYARRARRAAVRRPLVALAGRVCQDSSDNRHGVSHHATLLP